MSMSCRPLCRSGSGTPSINSIGSPRREIGQTPIVVSQVYRERVTSRDSELRRGTVASAYSECSDGKTRSQKDDDNEDPEENKVVHIGTRP